MRRLVLVLSVIAAFEVAEAQSDTNLVWPQPPDRARVRFLETISYQQHFKHESGGLFSKIVSFVFGEHQDLSWLVQPVGIAVSPQGKIYVADPGAHGIHVIDRAEQEYKFLHETKDGQFVSPVGITVAPDGTVFVSDSERGDIVALDKDNDPEFAFGDHLVRPTGLSIDQGRLYVADPGRQKVLIFDLKGTYIGEFGQRGVGDGEFNYPIDVVGVNSLYVVDALNYRIQEFDPGGKFASKFGRQGNAAGLLASPKSVALDSDGNIYVTDALMDNFQIFDKQGQLMLVVGQQGVSNGRFMSPGGITIDDKDNIYIVDMLNKRIQIFKYVK